MTPELVPRSEDGVERPTLVWRLARPWRAVTSAPLGGGIGRRGWIVNATVPMSYDRDDPDQHLAELAAELGLDGPGVGFLTGVDVRRVVHAADGGVEVAATVGLDSPEWAAAPEGAADAVEAGPVGTVNVVAFVPVRLADAALVNAVATATEAKVQALWERGVAGTGTATDAVCVLCPPEGRPEAYGGPRSTWGARLARAVHRAVTGGARAWRTEP